MENNDEFMKNAAEAVKRVAKGSADGQAEKGSYEYGYNGVPFEIIVEELCKVYGVKTGYNFNKVAIKGFVQHLRRLCGSNKEYILRMLGCFKDPKGELPGIVDRACELNYDMELSEMLRDVIKRAEERMSIIGRFVPVESVVEEVPFEDIEPKMPERLPALVEHLIKNVPLQCRPSAACGIFPALGVLMHGVRFKLIDGTEKEPTFMCVNMADQSTGKGCINQIVECILSDVRKHDELHRRLFEEWKVKRNLTPENRDKERRPEGIYWQWTASDMNNPVFVRLLEMADGRFLYTKMEELALLTQLDTNGDIGVSKIIDLAFDCGVYGQERVGAESVTANVRVRWNWNASSTVEQGREFFRRLVGEGCVSRINFCTIIKDEFHDFEYGEYDEEFGKVLEPYKRCLMMASGLIECQEAKTMAKRLLEKCKDIRAMYEDVVYEYYMYRAVTIAYMKAMTLYIANDMTWDESIEEFAEWSLDYDLWCKDMFFGDYLQEFERKSKAKPVRRGPDNMLGMLEDTFTELQALDVRRMCGKDDNVKHQLAVWVNRGYIVYDSENKVYRKIKKI